MAAAAPRGRETDETTPFVADGHRDPSEERLTATRPSSTPINSQYYRLRSGAENRTEDHHEEKPKATHIPWQHKISLMNTILMGLVAILIPAAVGFLAFLWSYTDGGNVNPTFYRMVVGSWIVQAVTITAVVLRFAISTSAGIATSMLSALALETKGTNIRSAASISILRFVNSGPQSLLLDLKHTWKHNWRTTATVSFLFLTTLLLQFTSTLLASDLDNGLVIGPEVKNTTNTRITQDNLDLAEVSVSLSGTPRDFPSFAETHTPAGNDSDAIRDTGILLRGLLPFTSSAARTSIEAFSGQSAILDSRVACVRPQMHEEMSVMYDVRAESWLFNGTWLPEGNVEGLLPADFIPGIGNVDDYTLDLNYNNATFARYITRIKELNYDNTRNTTYAEMSSQYKDLFTLHFYETVVNVPYAQNDSAWTLSFMPLESGPVLLSTLDPRYPFTSTSDVVDPAPTGYPTTRLQRFKQDDPVALLTGTSYLVVNITNNDPTTMPSWNGNATDLLNNSYSVPAYLFATYEEGFAKLVLTPRGQWLTYSLPEHPGWEASISLCYDSSVAFDLQVNMSTNKAVSEPSLSVFNDTTKHFDTQEILSQLDHTTARTDVLALATSVDDMRSQMSPSYNTALEKNRTYMDLQNWVPSELQGEIYFKRFYIMCKNCTHSDTSPTFGGLDGTRFGQYNGGDIGYTVTGATQQIFMDTVQSTGNIALALSDYMTVIARAVYYDALPYFDLSDETTFHLFESGLFPARFTGFIIVLAALLTHVCIVTTITIVFLTRTRVSRIGDAAWQAVAQVHCQELRGLLPAASMASDDSFENHIADAGLGNDIASFQSARFGVVMSERATSKASIRSRRRI